MERPELFAQLLRQRTAIQTAAPRDLIGEELPNVTLPLSELYSAEFRQQVLLKLVLTKEMLIGHSGTIPSRSAICSQFLIEVVADRALDKASQYAYSQDAIRFQIIFDVACGVGYSLGAIMGANMAQSAQRSYLATLSSFSEDMNIPLQDQVDYFLRSQKNSQEFARQLIDDPSGYTLLDYAIDDLEQHWKIPESRIPFDKDCFMAGARVGGKTYKEVYPLTASLDH